MTYTVTKMLINLLVTLLGLRGKVVGFKLKKSHPDGLMVRKLW